MTESHDNVRRYTRRGLLDARTRAPDADVPIGWFSLG
jgi:hypothetical protein